MMTREMQIRVVYKPEAKRENTKVNKLFSPAFFSAESSSLNTSISFPTNSHNIADFRERDIHAHHPYPLQSTTTNVIT